LPFSLGNFNFNSEIIFLDRNVWALLLLKKRFFLKKENGKMAAFSSGGSVFKILN
jgi:hypothetical protein